MSRQGLSESPGSSRKLNSQRRLLQVERLEDRCLLSSLAGLPIAQGSLSPSDSLRNGFDHLAVRNLTVPSLVPAIAGVSQPVSTELVAVSKPATSHKTTPPQIHVDQAPLPHDHLRRGQSLKPSQRAAKIAHHDIESSPVPRTRADARATRAAARSPENALSTSGQDRQLLQGGTETKSVAGLSAEVTTHGSQASVEGATKQDSVVDLLVTDGAGDLAVLPAGYAVAYASPSTLDTPSGQNGHTSRSPELAGLLVLTGQLRTSAIIKESSAQAEWKADTAWSASGQGSGTPGLESVPTPPHALTAAAYSAVPIARPSNADIFATAVTPEGSQGKTASTKSMVTLAFSDRSTPIQIGELEWAAVPIQLSLIERADPLASQLARIGDESSGKSSDFGGRSLSSLFFATALAMPGGRKAPQSTILLVETDESLRDSLTFELTRHGFLVLPAATGRDALNLLRTPMAPIDVMLLDLQLPDVSGVDLWKRLQELQAQLPVVVCTGQAEPAQVVPLLPAGLCYYWQKPIEPNALVAAVSLLIRRAQGGAPESSPM
jgi:CheY-like chemotaxis protein